MPYLFLLYFVLYFILTWRNFKGAIGLFIFILPFAYLIRFEAHGLPSTVLELSFWAIFLVWILKYFTEDAAGLFRLIRDNKVLGFFFFLLFVGSTIGVFVSDEWFKSVGHWRAFLLEPAIFYFILLGRRQAISGRDLTIFLGFSTFSVSILAILQKFSFCFYPPKLLNEEVFGRVTSFFTSPNAVGLYLVPIFLLAVTTARSLKKWQVKYLELFIALNLAAIFFTFSQGSWVALAVGLSSFIFLLGYKKLVALAVVAGIIITAFVAPLRHALLFQDTAGQNRLTIWKYTTEYLTESPHNFLFGTGVRQWFRKVQKPHYFSEDNNLERLTFPHNVFLNFWTEFGLIGLIGFLGIMYFMFSFSFSIYKYQDRIFGAGLFSVWLAYMVHGLVDVPFFKNDLAFLFSILAVITSYYHYLFIGYNKGRNHYPTEVR